MAKHHLGDIPLFPKWRSRRRVEGLKRKLDHAKGQVCALEKKVIDEKRAAADLFTKSQYEQLINPLTERLDQTCACSKRASEKSFDVVGEEERNPRECRDQINDELEKKFPSVFSKLTSKQKAELMVRGQEKTRTDKQNKAVAECQKGGKVDYDELVAEIKEVAQKKGVSLSGRRGHR